MVTADLGRCRAFYEHTIGLRTTLVLGSGPGHGRQAVLVAGDALLHLFEVPVPGAADPARMPMSERGRVDHFGFVVADTEALEALRRRLLAAGASSGHIRRLGPMLSLRFHDPDGFEGEINCLDPAYDPATLRPEDEVVDPWWLERAAHVLRARLPLGATPDPPVPPPDDRITPPTRRSDR